MGAILAPVIWYANKAFTRNFGRDGFFPVSEYSALRESSNPAIVSHFPKSIPPNATGVRVWSNGLRGFFPSPDAFMQLRMIVPSLEAAAIETNASALQKALLSNPNTSLSSMDFICDHLAAADDQDSSTPLPSGFKTYILVNPSGGNQGGVTINAITGEVVYWYFEM